MMPFQFRPGVSVIVPTANGRNRLPRLLHSLMQQEAPTCDVEYIFVLNGQDDGTKDLLTEFKAELPEGAVRLLHSRETGASRARNIGLSVASRQYVTFIDDDDEIEPCFLNVALTYSRPNRVVLLPIVDIENKEGSERRIESTSLNQRIAAISGTSGPISDFPWVLGFNASKLVPNKYAQQMRYVESLKSGEDVVYFANLLRFTSLELFVPSGASRTSYLRHLRADSVSRQKETFDFSVVQRLDCIAALRAVPVAEGAKPALMSLERSQYQFVKGFLTSHPNLVGDAIGYAVQLGLGNLPIGELRQEAAQKLVISYCFPPFADTSANVVAKVISQEPAIVDVVSADMSAVRATDNSTLALTARNVGKHIELKVAPSFATWSEIVDFAVKAKSAASKMQPVGGYRNLYTRSMWTGSHVAGLLFKLDNPEVFWIAEFSDPLSRGVDGKFRVGPITRSRINRRIFHLLREFGIGSGSLISHFQLTELATMLLADRVVFTNQNQRAEMLDLYDDAIKSRVLAKAQVSKHPVPPGEMYMLGEASRPTSPNKCNIAYFGNFYANRSFESLFEAMTQLRPAIRAKIGLSVFCGSSPQISETIAEYGLEESIEVRERLDYLDFLATTRAFDVLLVNDTDTSGSRFKLNPFLPSKYADYLGAEIPIWGMVEEDSPLAQESLDFRSRLGSIDETKEILARLVSQSYGDI